MYNQSMPPPPPPPAYSPYSSGGRTTSSTNAAPASSEAYGSVSYSVPQQQQQQQQQQTSYQSQQTRRRQTDTTTTTAPTIYSSTPPTSTYYRQSPMQTTTSSTGMYPPSHSPIPPKQQHSNATTTYTYQHNVSALLFLSPILAILWFHPSAYPLQVFLFVVLALYGVDLANDRDLTVVGIWIAFCVVSATNAWMTFLEIATPHHNLIMAVLQISTETLLFLCLACWSTLQLTWLHTDMPLFARQMERILHCVLPPTCASVVSNQLTTLVVQKHWGTDVGTTMVPYLFCGLLTAGMLWIGSLPSSFQSSSPTTSSSSDTKKDNHHYNNNGASTTTTTTATVEPTTYILSSSAARIHSMLLLLGPPLMHVGAFSRRIMSAYASYDEWQDLILIWSIPYLLHYMICMFHHTQKWSSPYQLSLLFPKAVSTGTSLRGAFVPICVSVIASLALQQRHLIPLCHFVSYQFNGHDLPSTTIVSIYLSVGTLFALFAAWINGRKSSTTNELLFGEYQEDVVQLAIGGAGAFFGRAMGMSWSLLPLPVLLSLGLVVWISTGMLRFLMIVLFTVHSGTALLFSYRYGGIQYTIPTALLGYELSLFRFGMAAVFASCMIGTVLGFAVRPSGGVGSDILKRLDVPGMLLIGYQILLGLLEFTLLKQPIPFRDLVGINQEDTEVDDGDNTQHMMYNPLTCIATSGGLLAIVLVLKKFQVVSRKSSVIATSFAIGKFVAVLIDMQTTMDTNTSEDEEEGKGKMTTQLFKTGSATQMLVRYFVASILMVVMIAPPTFLQPIYVKTGSSRLKRFFGPSGKPPSELPNHVGRTIFLYFFVVLPSILIVAAPLVLQPLIGIVSGRYSGAYYTSSPAASEVIGLAAALWGVSCLFMVNSFLPDGGGESWKKLSALTFLMGLGLTLAAPTTGGLLSTTAGASASSSTASNNLDSPFATISSLGSAVVSKGNRSGGWGLLSSSLATLLALTGPLELTERKDTRSTSSHGKDRTHLLRLMIFSLMFGCGIAWFVSMQSMSEEEFLPVFLVTTSCMAMSFFGTVASVLGFFLELESFGEVEEVMAVWGGAFPIFLFIAGVSQFVKEADHPFGIGGWLSTYLSVCAIVTFGFSLVLKARSTKNTITRGKSNLSCILSWVFTITILYGKYGVAGLDVNGDVTRVFGMPASVFGTVIAGSMLLALEGEVNTGRSNRIQKLSASQSKAKHPFGVNFDKLQHSNRFAPVVAGTALIFVCASMHAILFRGAGWFFVGSSSGDGIATSHEDVFAAVYGSSSKLDDVATLAEKNLIHSRVMVTAAKLAGAGFFTSNTIFGPLLHLGGLVATLPSLYLLVSYMWNGQKIPLANATLTLPLNLIPILLCRGIPTLYAAAMLGGIGGSLEVLSARQKNWESNMQI